MGLRMKVAVGYGLDLNGLNTDRLEEDDFLEDEDLFRAFVREALEDAQARGDLPDRTCLEFAMKDKLASAKAPPANFSETLDHDEESFEDKILLYPLGYKDLWYRSWNRLDDFIYEAYQDPSEPGYLEPECRPVPGTLFPFSNYMFAEADAPRGIGMYRDPLLIDSEERKNATPMAPMHLWHLIRHLELTQTDEETTAAFLSLRPTFMRWWS